MSVAFKTLTGIAAPLPIANIDTDMILPATFMKTLSRKGLGGALFHRQRFDAAWREREDFILNRATWRHAQILIALDNFGCGSSREHAPWALRDFGITCIIAPSFADIFYGNCLQNGMLPIILPHDDVRALLVLASDARSAEFTVDLERQDIATAEHTVPFTIDPKRRARLLDGIDAIGVSLQFTDEIEQHERWKRSALPWLATTRVAGPG